MSEASVHCDNNLKILRDLKSESIDLIYIDPPFNTGKTQKIHGKSYNDSFVDYIEFLRERLIEARRVLTSNGSIFVHLDYREVHYVKIEMDKIFSRDNFRNEIIWAYDYGGRSKSKWSAKHDNILWYTKSPDNYTFNYEEMDRIPYMAPGLVGKEKAARGKTPTDCWWHTIVPTNGKERVGYPTQKPLGILRRIIKIHSNPGNTVLDFFCGSGTTGVAALELDRNCILVDNNPEAIEITKARLKEV